MRSSTRKLDDMFWSDMATLYDKHKCERLIVIGDLLDSGEPGTEFLIEVEIKLNNWAATRGLTILMGNHESCSKVFPATSPLFFLRDVGADTEPKLEILPEGKGVFFHLPWRPGKQLKELAKQFAAIAMTKQYAGLKKVLFCHAGLKEGEVSENYRVVTEVSIKDLCPDAYDFVMLGDYHRQQFLGDNAFYVGAPFPKSFKDTLSVGVFLLDLNGPEAEVYSLPLPSNYPQYKSWVVRASSDLPLEGYRPMDVNRIEVDPALSDSVRSLYPESQLLLTEHEPVLDRGRLNAVNTNEAEKVFLEYLRSRKIKDKKMLELGVGYIIRAKGVQ